MNVFKTRTWWVVIVTICFLAPLLHADSLRFKNGSIVDGKYLGGTDSQVTFYTGNQLKHYAIADIDSITFGGQVSTSSSEPMAAPAPVVQAPVASPQTSSQTSATNVSGADVLVPA
ncbi:MAG TPA: hypothetical protein VMW51_00480, partial [Terriglobia bacterium]|nr:hypothetical protein [Terriglobia bacterium]